MPGARITLTLPAEVQGRLGNATAALVDPELEQSRDARDGQAAQRVTTYRMTPRPEMYETSPPAIARPAPTGAMTLPIQLTRLRNAPSG